MSWWYVSSERMTGAVEVIDDRITQAPPIMRRFIGQPPRNLGNWLRSQGECRFERLPRWSNGKTADCQSADEGSIPSRGFRAEGDASTAGGRRLVLSTSSLVTDSLTHTYFWGNNEKRATMKGRPCRVIARGLSMRSVMVEFENGQREIVSYRALREREKM